MKIGDKVIVLDTHGGWGFKIYVEGIVARIGENSGNLGLLSEDDSELVGKEAGLDYPPHKLIVVDKDMTYPDTPENRGVVAKYQYEMKLLGDKVETLDATLWRDLKGGAGK